MTEKQKKSGFAIWVPLLLNICINKLAVLKCAAPTTKTENTKDPVHPSSEVTGRKNDHEREKESEDITLFQFIYIDITINCCVLCTLFLLSVHF